ncbi:WecC UDP-N-acetyl-D-mannosaminuronate dehydrogenase [Burkholderiales bacterium]
MNFSDRTIAVIGLGYVGLPLAVEFGKKRPVIGFDIKADRIEELQARHDHTLEVSQEELREAKHLTYSADASLLRGPAGAEADNADQPMIFIVTVPTPVDKANRPDLTPLTRASETVGGVLKPGDVVIYESTVYPGCTEEVCVPILERDSGLKYLTADDTAAVAAGFYCGYSPERMNPGDKTHRLTDIKKLTSGSTPEVARAVDNLYQEIITAGTHLASSIKVAEAAKVIENAQRDLNIAFVNELSVIFNRMGIDTTEVLTAASTKWNFLPFKPGLVGGHCIGVDPYYLTHKAQELGYRPQVLLSGRAINDNMGRYAARNVIRLMLKNGINVASATVGVLGITFKENCPDVRNSKVKDIVNELQDWGLTVRVMDPWANAREVQQECGFQLTSITMQTQVDSLIIAVAHTQFAQMTPDELRKLCVANSKPVIADLKALHDRGELEAQGFEVFRL